MDEDAPKTEADEFRELVGRANRGDAAAREELRETLDRCPHLWQEFGNLAAMTKSVLIRLASAGNQLLLESLHRSADELERELAGESPSPILKLTPTGIQVVLALEITNCKAGTAVRIT